jgi:hypothetical protein
VNDADPFRNFELVFGRNFFDLAKDPDFLKPLNETPSCDLEPKLDLVRVFELGQIFPSPENDEIYGAISQDDPEIIELARSIKAHGVQDPLIISRDGFIISGHRRWIAARLAGLTIDQVEEFHLEPSMEAKDSSPTYGGFVEKYGITSAYELEAFDPADLAEVLESGIEEVLDIDAYNCEIEAEEADSAHIIAVREQVETFLKSLKLDGEEGGERA